MDSQVKMPKAGIGLRHEHWQEFIEARPDTGFLEIHAENFLGHSGQHILQALRADYPFSVHAVGLSLASAAGIDTAHLEQVAVLVERLEPALVSDHLCWSSFEGVYFNDLIPFPYTQESLRIVACNIQQVQDRLRRPLLIENISAYVQFSDSYISEQEFFNTLVARTGCGILCDVNNAYVNQVNHGADALAWIRSLPAASVGEIHLAGHCANDIGDGIMLIDDHGSAVIDPVWALYEEAAKLFPDAATLVEWDTNIPTLAVLLSEARKADDIHLRITRGGDVIAA